MAANDLGLIVAECWLQISQVRPYIELDAYVVMPNHIHGILSIFDKETASDSVPPKGTATSSEGKLKSDSLGVIIGQFKRAVTIRSRSRDRPPLQRIWQRNYYDHIIRNENSLNDIRKYIIENPGKWHDDSMYVE